MADTKYSALTAVSTPTLESEFGVNEAGTSKKMTLLQALSISPTAPTIISVGAEFSSTGVPTATLPGTHALNDILVLVLQTENDSQVTAPAGYQNLGPQNATYGVAGATPAKLCVFWKRDNGAEGVPTIPDTGGHTYGMMFAVRGCATVGDPFHLQGQNYKFTSSTTGTSSKIATTINNCLIVDVFAHSRDAAGANATAPTNAGLTSVTEQFDGATADGTGGGIVVVSGLLARRGKAAATTITWTNAVLDVSTCIAFIPDITGAFDAPRPVEVQTFIGTPASIDDLWIKPPGARMVLVQTCDGGGSGSSGITIGTPAGGGGGGGGGFRERFFDASFLADSVTVLAGKGGAATSAAVGQAGNPGVVSQFGKGLTLPYLTGVAGTAATAAISADGGNGGCGSGIAVHAVQTTRTSLSSTTPNVALGEVGAGGGSGTTAPVGGCESESGGGGGESGADSDAGTTSANNGNSFKGGGGGAGGRTTGTASGSGAGGGAAAQSAVAGSLGTDSTRLPYGGAGGGPGSTATPAGGTGGFPGGGGGGGGGNVATTQGGAGGAGAVVVTTFF